MTPAEKAKDLYNKMCLQNNIYQAKQMAKKCALISVDEIIHDIELNEKIQEIEYGWCDRNKGYWIEVKQEIEKL
jgi:hypothetical protein